MIPAQDFRKTVLKNKERNLVVETERLRNSVAINIKANMNAGITTVKVPILGYSKTSVDTVSKELQDSGYAVREGRLGLDVFLIIS